MSSFTNTWNATYLTLPADTENISVGASRIRDFKNDLTQRLQIDHSLFGDAYDGTHLQSTLRVSAADPALISETGIVYTKVVSSGIELFYKDAVGNVVQLTTGGVIIAAIAAIVSAAAQPAITSVGALTGAVFNNNALLAWKDNAGVSRNVMNIGSDNELNLFSATNFGIRFLNQAGSLVLFDIDNSGNVLAIGTVTLANATNANEAVALGQADARYAAAAGNAANTFYVANAVNANEAVALGQADARYTTLAQSTSASHMTGNLLNAGRAAGTTYTNTTARVIFVMAGSATGTGLIQGYVNGVNVVTYATNSSEGQLFMPVPPGATYEIIESLITLNTWYELS